MAPGEAGTHHGCGDLSGVNETPLLRWIEFTHAPAQAWEGWRECGGKASWNAAISLSICVERYTPLAVCQHLVYFSRKYRCQPGLYRLVVAVQLGLRVAFGLQAWQRCRRVQFIGWFTILQRSQLQFARDELVVFPICLSVVHRHFTPRSKFQELVERHAGEFRRLASGEAALAKQFERDELRSGS